MRAVVDPDGGNRLALREDGEGRPSPSEALVRVAAVSLNRGGVRRSQREEAGFRPGWDLTGTVERAARDGRPYGRAPAAPVARAHARDGPCRNGSQRIGYLRRKRARRWLGRGHAVAHRDDRACAHGGCRWAHRGRDRGRRPPGAARATSSGRPGAVRSSRSLAHGRHRQMRGPGGVRTGSVRRPGQGPGPGTASSRIGCFPVPMLPGGRVGLGEARRPRRAGRTRGDGPTATCRAGRGRRRPRRRSGASSAPARGGSAKPPRSRRGCARRRRATSRRPAARGPRRSVRSTRGA